MVSAIRIYLHVCCLWCYLTFMILPHVQMHVSATLARMAGNAIWPGMIITLANVRRDFTGNNAKKVKETGVRRCLTYRSPGIVNFL